ncbi:hypothetical protein [Hansschlegelia sp.]|uniref:hypothetical protein n=1 Tax=Hansschlegelia sp. TaxID=2041892 RepID=UPI002C3B622B|nr:hypothetical protein [Hansschlegelia sp.]HVI29913.1 hypothetical protein [Hansschlegelia sp.]
MVAKLAALAALFVVGLLLILAGLHQLNIHYGFDNPVLVSFGAMMAFGLLATIVVCAVLSDER